MKSNFEFQEATVQTIHAAMKEGTLTAKTLVQWYLNRIETFDHQGPSLNAVILVNPNALQEAEKLDQTFQKDGFVGPLHGIPVLLKDNVETKDMPTTAGSLSLKDFYSEKDAFITKKIRAAGAIIIAKTNLHEFAVWGETTSSILGQTLNPYDLTRTPGGSSGGTGAGIAANYGVLGIGTDTINSVRSPASANSLVGIRPTLGLVSRAGIVPYSLTQDTAGPLCRNVEDAAKMLEVIAGFDTDDSVTAWAFEKQEKYSNCLDINALKGKRIGVLESFFGTEAIHQDVNKAVRNSIVQMQKAGAEIISVSEVIDSGYLASKVSVHLYDLKEHLNAYLKQQGAKVHYHTLAEIIASGKYSPSIDENIHQAEALSVHSMDYKQRLFERGKLQEQVMKLMADYNLDALVYPHQKRPVVPVGETQVERNGVLGSVTGFPSIIVPAGFTSPDNNAPIGVPVGLELLGRPWSEGKLIGMAYAFEQHTKFRKPPVSTPF